jgi:hypothetical protein
MRCLSWALASVQAGMGRRMRMMDCIEKSRAWPGIPAVAMPLRDIMMI